MLLNKGQYKDNLSKIQYNLKFDLLIEENKIILIKGENGVGKSRFTEGVLLKELKKNSYRMLYFGQDIENQILSFNLITLVKSFVDGLKKQGSFLKTIFLNDDSHKSIELDFDEESTLNPNNQSIKNFILNECQIYKNLDVVIFDEADKYFSSPQEFLTFLETIEVKTIFIISHVISGVGNTLTLLKDSQGVNIEFLNN